jgi:2-dehydro-3-deoxyphosphogluconate aldolase / (4S)-4-hydroxy-2-oxoglutarate aldolase
MMDKQLHSTVSKIISGGVIPVFFHPDEAVCLHVMDACYRAGVRAFEFTNRGEGAAKTFAVMQRHAEANYKDLLLGIGTIFSFEEGASFADSGAHFIVSPVLVPQMRELQTRFGIPWVPGCGTVTEVWQASQLGAGLMKIFPGQVLGPSFISAVLAVMPTLRLMPTGGVESSEENISSWKKSGAACVGIGSSLFSKELLATKDWNKLESSMKKLLDHWKA